MMKFLMIAITALLVISPALADDMEKAELLAAASGLSVTEIMAMRTGEATTMWVDTDGDGLYDTLITVEGEPMGWGEIAKKLGLHPSILGNAKGKKK